jgi:hypothetical protein
MCLGVNWGHIIEPTPVLDKDGKELDPRQFVKSRTDMAGVVPSWRIKEILNYQNLRDVMRQIEDQEMARLRGRVSAEPAAASGDLPATDENPNHREDFMRLVGVAARKREPED